MIVRSTNYKLVNFITKHKNLSFRKCKIVNRLFIKFYFKSKKRNTKKLAQNIKYLRALNLK